MKVVFLLGFVAVLAAASAVLAQAPPDGDQHLLLQYYCHLREDSKTAYDVRCKANSEEITSLIDTNKGFKMNIYSLIGPSSDLNCTVDTSNPANSKLKVSFGVAQGQTHVLDMNNVFFQEDATVGLVSSVWSVQKGEGAFEGAMGYLSAVNDVRATQKGEEARMDVSLFFRLPVD